MGYTGEGWFQIKEGPRANNIERNDHVWIHVDLKLDNYAILRPVLITNLVLGMSFKLRGLLINLI